MQIQNLPTRNLKFLNAIFFFSKLVASIFLQKKTLKGRTSLTEMVA